jgi:hypothetical protein
LAAPFRPRSAQKNDEMEHAHVCTFTHYVHTRQAYVNIYACASYVYLCVDAAMVAALLVLMSSGGV